MGIRVCTVVMPFRRLGIPIGEYYDLVDAEYGKCASYAASEGVA